MARVVQYSSSETGLYLDSEELGALEAVLGLCRHGDVLTDLHSLLSRLPKTPEYKAEVRGLTSPMIIVVRKNDTKVRR